MSYAIDPDDLEQVIALVKSAGIKNVTSIASDVKTNHGGGVWVNVKGYKLSTLRGYELQTVLYLVVPDRDADRDRSDLIQLLNKVLTKVKPSGLIVPATVVLPHSPAKLPGFAVPFNVTCTAD